MIGCFDALNSCFGAQVNKPFTLAGRNNEDLGVEIFSPSANFDIEMPLITSNWGLSLGPGDRSPCHYDWVNYRYCVQVKTMIKSSASPRTLTPELRFSVNGSCAGRGSVEGTIELRRFVAGAVEPQPVATVSIAGGASCSAPGAPWSGATTKPVTAAAGGAVDRAEWITTSVVLADGSVGLNDLTHAVQYHSVAKGIER